MDVSYEVPVNKKLSVYIYPEKEKTYYEITEEEVLQFGESKHQLLEGQGYEYALSDKNYKVIEQKGIISVSKTHSECGRITPGIFTGTLQIDIVNINNSNEILSVLLEVRSIKVGYRNEYRVMLEEISEKCTDLLMQYSSPVTQFFDIDYNQTSNTLYQRFAFINSIITSEDFINASHKIIISPTVKWKDDSYAVDIRKASRLDRKAVKQIASSRVRVPVPKEHSLYNKMKTLPEKIIISGKSETIDTPENRFIKYALNSFLYFIISIQKSFVQKTRAFKEAEICINTLEDILSHEIFKEISTPESLALNSPILQRKEGYREIYRAWLMFDLASKLVWEGGEDVYDAGKRDIATLYEYWVYFKLLDLFSSIFKLDSKPADQLITQTKNGLGLTLKSGKHTALEGIYDLSEKKLNIKFSFNRTFSGNKRYPTPGSWTLSMRPDYTLSIWPETLKEKEAEELEKIVHIHFDAKYKIENIITLFNNVSQDEDFDNELEEQKKGKYKRVDILKMHAYKDAVRRTAGAFVIYPGIEEMYKLEYHEILPGLGAFPLRPSKDDSGIKHLKAFIEDVIDNFFSKPSKYKEMSSNIYNINKIEDETSN